MKLIKMFGLAVIAAIASMAFLGASSASAENTVLCLEHPFDAEEGSLTACPNEKKYENKLLVGLSTNALLSASFVHYECAHSEILGEVLELGSPLVGHVTLLDFSSCECLTEVIDQTGLVEILKNGLNTGKGQASGFLVLVECLGLHCEYGGVVSEGLSAEGSNGTELGKIVANAAPLKKVGGNFFCPATSEWTATYNIRGELGEGKFDDLLYIAS